MELKKVINLYKPILQIKDCKKKEIILSNMRSLNNKEQKVRGYTIITFKDFIKLLMKK